MSEGRENPTRQEVFAQLERINDSVHFAKASKLKHLLRYIVENALAGNPISEKDIGPVVFPPFDPESNPVRVQALNVRGRLQKYYQTDGQYDLVEVELLAGAGYKAVFRYSERSPVLTHLRKARAYMSELNFYGLIAGANNEISNAIEREPGFAPAHALRAEFLMLQLLISHIFSVTPSPSIYSFNADDEAKRAIELDANLCAGHIMSGMLAVLNLRWEDARGSFDTALKVDRQTTEASLWYGLYLLLIGKSEEALSIGKSNVREQPESNAAWLTYALFLYLTRDFHNAHAAIYEICPGDFLLRLRKLLDGLIGIAWNSYAESINEFGGASEMTRGEIREVMRRWKLEEAAMELVDRRLRFIGLILLCLERSGQHDHALEYEDALNKVGALVSEDAEIKPIQRAFIHMACGRGNRAITALRIACLRGDPIALGLHLWPFLDDYRDHPRFRRLVERFQPPQQIT